MADESELDYEKLTAIEQKEEKPGRLKRKISQESILVWRASKLAARGKADAIQVAPSQRNAATDVLRYGEIERLPSLVRQYNSGKAPKRSKQAVPTAAGEIIIDK